MPKLQLHRATGRGRVTIGGVDHYLPKFGTPECEEEYRQLVGQFLTTGIAPEPVRVPKAKPSGLIVAELVARYLAGHVNSGYYTRPDGTETREAENIRDTLKELRLAYGATPVEDFGPLDLEAVRSLMVKRNLARGNVNARIQRIKRMFRWGVAKQLVPVDVHQALTTLEGLRKGRSAAKETQPIRPVPESDINVAMKHLPSVLVAMVQLQLLTGARPGEICAMRPCDVNRNGEVWAYVPAYHKMEHAGKSRVVMIGPRAQVVLQPFLDNRPAGDHCFSPAEAQAERNAAKRSRRKSKVQPSQIDRSRPDATLKPGDSYSVAVYRRALSRACEAAGVPPFAPNRLRHTAATLIRRDFGLEAVQVALGHSKADVSQIYAETSSDLARKVAAEIG